MLDDTHPFRFDFAVLDRDPGELDVPDVGPQPAIWWPDDPDVSDVVADDPWDEPMIPVDWAPGVIDLAAYFRAGWTDACPVSYARRDVVDRLGRVAGRLGEGFGIAVYDAWRPMALQQAIFDAAYSDPSLPPGFVSPPSADPGTPPPHTTGGAVDVTLTWHEVPLRLGTKFDDFTERAALHAYETTPGRVRDLRRLLHRALAPEGFVPYLAEWWHLEHGTRTWAAFTNQPVRYGRTGLPSRAAA